MQVILIGNYPREKQNSMECIAQMLRRGYRNAEVETTIGQTTSDSGDWIGDIGKWIVFPLFFLGGYEKRSSTIQT